MTVNRVSYITEINCKKQTNLFLDDLFQLSAIFSQYYVFNPGGAATIFTIMMQFWWFNLPYTSWIIFCRCCRFKMLLILLNWTIHLIVFRLLVFIFKIFISFAILYYMCVTKMFLNFKIKMILQAKYIYWRRGGHSYSVIYRVNYETIYVLYLLIYPLLSSSFKCIFIILRYKILLYFCFQFLALHLVDVSQIFFI